MSKRIVGENAYVHQSGIHEDVPGEPPGGDVVAAVPPDEGGPGTPDVQDVARDDLEGIPTLRDLPPAVVRAAERIVGISYAGEVPIAPEPRPAADFTGFPTMP